MPAALQELSAPPGFIVDDELRFNHDRLRRLFEMWRARRVDGRLPARGDFDVLEFRDFMGWLCIAEVLPGGEDLRYRLIGTNIVDRVGRDNTGKLVSETLPPEALRIYHGLLRCPVALKTHGEIGWRGRDFLYHETLLLPLADDGETVDRFFVLMAIDRSTP